jgi:hypothetical protein
MLLWTAIGLLLVICLVAVLNLQPARQLIESICAAVQCPFSVVQNALAAAVSGLREAAARVFASVGSLQKAVGAFIHLVVFVLLSFCGLFLTLLTIAGLFGMELSWSPPTSLEVLSAIGFTVGLAFLVAVLLEMFFGLPHFGLWETIPARIKPLAFVALTAAIGLGVALIFWMGQARWHAMQVDTEKIQVAVPEIESAEIKALEGEIQSLAASSEEAANTKKVMIGLPLFVDSVAALAFSGALLGLQILGACLLWLLAVPIQIINIPFTIVAWIIYYIYNAMIAIADFLNDLGRRFGWQGGASQNHQAPSNEQQQSHQQASAQNSSLGGQTSQQQSQTVAPLPQAENDGNFPEPELIPIGATALDPLGLGGDHDDKSATGGVQ